MEMEMDPDDMSEFYLYQFNSNLDNGNLEIARDFAILAIGERGDESAYEFLIQYHDTNGENHQPHLLIYYKNLFNEFQS